MTYIGLVKRLLTPGDDKDPDLDNQDAEMSGPSPAELMGSTDNSEQDVGLATLEGSEEEHSDEVVQPLVLVGTDREKN